MTVRKVSKTVFRNVRRSNMHHLMNCKLPAQNASHLQTGSDALGVVIVIALLAELVGFMRYLLAG